MSRTNENVESIVTTKTTVRVPLPPKRGQIKAKIMTQFVKAGRSMFGKEKVAKESDSSQPNDSSHA